MVEEMVAPTIIEKFKYDVIYLANEYDNDLQLAFNGANIQKFQSINSLYESIINLSVYELNAIVIIEVNEQNSNEALQMVTAVKQNWIFKNLRIIFLLTGNYPDIKSKAFKLRVSDCYTPPFAFTDIKLRIRFLFAYQLLNPQANLTGEALVPYQIPFVKRAFDLVMASLAIIFLSPVFLIVAILVRLDSKGPIFYVSKRVGTGYKIFDFYKFRSMRVNAEKEVESMKSDNQYGASAFFKIKNDPRVTKLGNFLRSSSIDELPQLFNVVKGDMSLVGNRPLPLYEAQQLTTNEWSMRFLGPAGITGLWQIIKRGKSDMSDRERKKLDNFYNKKNTLWLDFKIIMKTLTVLIQKEKV